MAYTFDGPNKRITLSAGTVTLDLVDLHSRWKDWVMLGNAHYLPAFRAVGGDIPAIPLYLFLLNGWRIVPQQDDHTLTVTNGVFEVDGGGDPFVDPVGDYAIRINRATPGIAIGYASGGASTGPSAADIAAAVAPAVWGHLTGAAVATRLAEVWGRLGLDPSKPLTDGETSISFGDIVLQLAQVGSSYQTTRTGG